MTPKLASGMGALNHVELGFGDGRTIRAFVAEKKIIAVSYCSNRGNAMEMFDNDGTRLSI